MAFVKIYGSILDSSIWASDLPTRVVWITMLAMADKDGIVTASIDGLARRANISEDQCESAVTNLRQPDRRSKSKENQGRRLRPVKGGWLILNYKQYREMRTESQVDAAERQKRHRAKDKSVTCHVTSCDNGSVTPEGEVEVEVETTTTARQKRRSGLPPYDQVFEESWGVYPKRDGHSKTGSWRQWLTRVKEGVDPLDMLTGSRSYALRCERERTEPRYVKLAQTFFGPNRHFAADWGPVAGPDPTPAEVIAGVMGVPVERILQLWAEEDQGLAIAQRQREVA